MASLSFRSRFMAGTSSISAPARSRLAGATNKFLTETGSIASSSSTSCKRTSYSEWSSWRRFKPSPVLALACGSRSIIEPDAPTQHAGIDGRGRLPDTTLLIGNRSAGTGGEQALRRRPSCRDLLPNDGCHPRGPAMRRGTLPHQFAPTWRCFTWNTLSRVGPPVPGVFLD